MLRSFFHRTCDAKVLDEDEETGVKNVPARRTPAGDAPAVTTCSNAHARSFTEGTGRQDQASFGREAAAVTISTRKRTHPLDFSTCST
jgi:hypothetical protein